MGERYIREEEFTPEFENEVRLQVNRNTGGANVNPEAHKLPQDKLLRQHIIIHGNCGVSWQFDWASGRQDGHIAMMDLDDAGLMLRAMTDPVGTKVMLQNFDTYKQAVKEKCRYVSNESELKENEGLSDRGEYLITGQ